MARITVACNVRTYITYEVNDIPDEWVDLLTDDITEDQELAQKIAIELEDRVMRGAAGTDGSYSGDVADEPDYNIWLEPDDE